MKQNPCLSIALAAIVLGLSPDAATGQVARRKEPVADQGDSVPKKRYSRGIKGGLAAPDTPAPAPSSARIQWEPAIGMDAQIFPSYIVSTATMRLPQEDDVEEDPFVLGEALGLVGVSMEHVPAGSSIKVEIKPNAVMEASVFQGRASAGAGDYEVYPKINYKFDTLLDWRQPMPMNIVMEVFVGGRSLGTRSSTVTVRSINDCPFVVTAEEDSDEEDLDLSWMFAAYVNENHPFVDTLTRESIESKIVDSFSAYQEEDPAGVLRQVYAIWHTLQRRGLRYSDISQSSAESSVVGSQHVRLFEEALTAKQANCVDGTALMAAVLRKIGIAPYLAIIPGHMFLAFDLDEEGENTVGLETTMMGLAGPAEMVRNKQMPDSLTAQFRAQPSFRSFSAALAEGTSELKKNRAKMDSDDADYQLISLSAARDLGILPLAYRRPVPVASRP
jgi:hypothetical protein